MNICCLRMMSILEMLCPYFFPSHRPMPSKSDSRQQSIISNLFQIKTQFNDLRDESMGLCTNQQIRFDPIIGLAVGLVRRYPLSQTLLTSTSKMASSTRLFKTLNSRSKARSIFIRSPATLPPANFLSRSFKP